MSYEKMVSELGACGIDCTRCVSLKGGEVQQLSLELKAALAGFEKKAPAFSGFVPALKEYGHFEAVLEFLSSGSCRGCRSGECLSPGCAAKNCHSEMGVDFCFQCKEYPCTRNNFSPELEAKWRRFNDEMKADGVEMFYKRSKENPRY